MCNFLSLCCQRAKWRPVIGRACDIHSIYSIYPSLHALRTILSVCPIGRVTQLKFNAAINIVYMGVKLMHCQVRSPLLLPPLHAHFKNKTRNSNWIHLVHNYVHFVLGNSVICFTLCELQKKNTYNNNNNCTNKMWFAIKNCIKLQQSTIATAVSCQMSSNYWKYIVELRFNFGLASHEGILCRLTESIC